jgi:hypothetical protein
LRHSFNIYCIGINPWKLFIALELSSFTVKLKMVSSLDNFCFWVANGPMFHNRKSTECIVKNIKQYRSKGQPAVFPRKPQPPPPPNANIIERVSSTQ